MAYTRFSFRDEEERIEFLIALPILALFGVMLYHFVFAGDDLDVNTGLAVAATQASDIDSDGVIDTNDHCTAVAGTSANFGCPADQEVTPDNSALAMDTDGDGVTDAADRCPEVAGSVPDFGCPAGGEEDTEAEMPADSDGDGVTDDADQCPTEAGNSATGCPAPATQPVQAADADADGVPDAEDSCPDVAGVAANQGCPAVVDSDGDGVPDAEDLCPQSSGVAENRGCPADSDADGLPDSQDQCPDQQGPIESGGCPELDQDDDGIEDAMDECPEEPGNADNNGCPDLTDTDGDGFADVDDACPAESGVDSTDGCPVTQAEQEPAPAPQPVPQPEPAPQPQQQAQQQPQTLESLGSEITFETASATLTDESKELLDVVASILNKYPAVKLVVEGHTDNSGQPDINLRLSEQRARACTTYLARQGVAPERMQAIGFGDTRPIVPNDSAEARSRNRRVEFKLTN